MQVCNHQYINCPFLNARSLSTYIRPYISLFHSQHIRARVWEEVSKQAVNQFMTKTSADRRKMQSDKDKLIIELLLFSLYSHRLGRVQNDLDSVKVG